MSYTKNRQMNGPLQFASATVLLLALFSCGGGGGEEPFGDNVNNGEVSVSDSEIVANNNNGEGDAGNTDVDAGNTVDGSNVDVDGSNTDVDSSNLDVDAGNTDVDGSGGDGEANSDEFVANNVDTGRAIERLTFTEDQEELNDHVTGEGTYHITNDGRYLLFTTIATNVVANDGPADTFDDVYLRDTVSGAATKISRATENAVNNGRSIARGISDDGRFSLFTSFSSGIHAEANGSNQLYLFDALSDTVELISRDLAGEAGRGNSSNAFISSDGSTVLFTTLAANIVNDFGGEVRVTLAYDVESGALSRVGNMIENVVLDLSSDGRYVLFSGEPVDVYDRGTESVRSFEGSDSSTTSRAISDDGRYVAFSTLSSDFVTRVDLQQNTELTINLNALLPQSTDTAFNRRIRLLHMSSNGQYILYYGLVFDGNIPVRSDNLHWDIYSMDLEQPEAMLVSRGVDQSNQQPNGLSGGNGRSLSGQFFNDDRSILFHSEAGNLITDDNNFRDDLFSTSLSDGL